METRNSIDSRGFYDSWPYRSKTITKQKSECSFFPGCKIEEFYCYLVLLMKKKPDKIILHFHTKDTPNKNEYAVYKELYSIKDSINKQHPSCKEIYCHQYNG